MYNGSEKWASTIATRSGWTNSAVDSISDPIPTNTSEARYPK